MLSFDPSRRLFGQQALGSLLTFSLIDSLARYDLFAEEIKPLTLEWVKGIDDLCREVKDQKLKQTEWQTKIEELYGQVELKDLLEMIDFDKLTKELKLAEKGEKSLRFSFNDPAAPKSPVFGKQIFALAKGCSVVPHGHNNMATAFLILSGEFQGRHFDRLEDLPDHMIIKPTIDRKFETGEYSTISDYKDNIHWFTALSERAFIFNIHVDDIRPDSKLRTGRVYVDPEGEKLEGGKILAPLATFDEVNKKYG